ncbi:asparagine synthase (glutamine-hydrolyzing) [Oscillochloris trichoides DG-6]|uniref:asparagine synthase (glutamine-hydrolyzing) n=1 Tax=Oscillochloris trichoides DG-6 TaxID=765420 RepID=E1IHE6_9CHLR|nr:asparagine synthase (glutamine-hydrolyzing) [Oscillochloris trichoides]EFO79399.1 asparagine synthase (glutamine-hydrolyzing) [Oscillochloris trichoides DG-6]
MCGIAGALNLIAAQGTPLPDLQAMLAMLTHRGPEEAGFYADDRVGLAHARLSIVGVSNGLQPIPNEEGTIWAICNGEFFNYVELRNGLRSRGHQFRTDSDTEVLVHLYEEQGWQAIEALNGQFALALWDARQQRLMLGRDRLGVRPLFYTTYQGQFLFASEIKALFAAGVPRQLDAHGLAEVFTLWSPLPGGSIMAGVREVLPGHVLFAHPGTSEVRQPVYWQLRFPAVEDLEQRAPEEYVEEIRAALHEATRLRLRADVPVGAYLSGGLDSTLISSIAQSQLPHQLHTFSVAFHDAAYDERSYQFRVAEQLGTLHHVIECDADSIRATLPDVLWHTEVPLLRLTPVAMYLLSQLVHQHGLKVMLSGEGADEFFGGYDIFKETMVRRFWARQPDSRLRPLLLSRIYEHIADLQALAPEMLRPFFGQHLTETHLPYYSHILRWQNTSRTHRLFAPDLVASLADYHVVDAIAARLPSEMMRWEPLARAQYTEISTFLSAYLLGSQGDRVGMAHAVECRHPFLDPHVVALSNRIPARWKLRGLRGEKYILRRAAQGIAPEEIVGRLKQPYRAPIRSVFNGRPLPDYAQELLSEAAIRASGIFTPQAVRLLVAKAQKSPAFSEVDQMAFIGVLTMQMIHHMFISDWDHQMATRRRDLRMTRLG